MLIVSRKHSESIEIRPTDDFDPQMTLADLFKAGPIEITIFSSGNNRVKMGVQAPDALTIWRKEPAPVSSIQESASGEAAGTEAPSQWRNPTRLSLRKSLGDREPKAYAATARVRGTR